MRVKLVLLLKAIFLSAIMFGQVDRAALLKEFITTNDDSVFITKHSKEPYQRFEVSHFTFLQKFSPIDSLIFYRTHKRTLIGPLSIDSNIIYIKITSIDSLFRMRVGNIWLSPDKRGADKIDKLAKDILETVTRTGDFNAMSKEYSDDSNTNFEADLGWFFQKTMVPEFEQEVLKHKKGDCYIVSTMYGKHVVKTIESPVLDRSKVEYVLLYLDEK